MKVLLLSVIFSMLYFSSVAALSLKDLLGDEPLTRERIVRDILDYYQREPAVGIPVLKVPDPLFVNASQSTLGLTLDGFEVSGTSQFKLQYVNVNATSLKASVLLRLPLVQILSQYTYASYFSEYTEGCNITITGLDFTISADLTTDSNSQLLLSSLQVGVSKESFLYEFKDAPVQVTFALAAIGPTFDTVVTAAINSRLDDATKKINERLNERFGDKRFPLGVHLLDLMLAELKKDLRHKMEPITVGSKVVQLPAGITFNASNICVTGLSTLHRDGEVSLQFIDDRLLLVLQLASQAISVQTDVEISVPLLPTTTSSVEFALDSFAVWIELQQSADVRHPPQLRRIHITLGNFRLLSSGDSTLSYLLEAAVNGIPNALRGPITKGIEPLLHKRIQQRLYALDIEGIINRRLEAMPNKDDLLIQ